MPVSSGTKPLKSLKPGMGLYQVFHWPGKAPDKSKPWAVANLETGDVNGRWHATKEEALAQARALYARLGDKAKVHGETTHNTFFCFADAALADPSENVTWIQAIAARTYHTPVYGAVEVTPEKLQNIVKNFHDNVRGQDIAINYDHGVDVAKGNKAAGWIRDARFNNGILELGVEFTEPAKQELKNKEWKYFSLEWDDKWMHPDGAFYSDVMMGGALTNRPVAKGLMPINFSELFEERADLEFAVWSTAYMNNLPDSAFLYVEDGGKKDADGKTVPRSLRHFPYKDANGNVDLPHLRNAIARIPQSSISDSLKSSLQEKARNILGRMGHSMGESKELEHSEPGTSNPPPPRTDGDGHDDKDRLEGWRRDTPPIAYDDVIKFAEPQLISYLDSAVKSIGSYIEATPDYYDKACANDLVSRIFNMQARLQAVQDNADSAALPMGGMMSEAQELAQEAYKELAKIETEISKSMHFSEDEAVGYLQASVAGLERIHTNRGNELIDDIQRIVATDRRTRSLNELMRLTYDVRTYLRNGTPSNSNSTSTSPKGGNVVGELTEKDLRELRGVLDVDDDGKILEAAKIKFGELTALREAVSASDQERIFAEQYPAFYQQHVQLMERDRTNAARVFSESVSHIRKQEGYGLKDTKQGLSVSAKEKVVETHKKFAEGKGTVADFEECVKMITNGGIVSFGEIGASSEEDIPEVDTTHAGGVANARKVFAEVVARIQRDKPDMPYLEAVAEASKKHPDLAESYKLALPA